MPRFSGLDFGARLGVCARERYLISQLTPSVSCNSLSVRWQRECKYFDGVCVIQTNIN